MSPFRMPKNDMTVPIIGGSSPRPPSAMGVEKNTGCRARKDMSTSARIAKFAQATITSRVRRPRNDTGPSDPSWGEDSEVRRGSSSDPTRFFSPRRNSRIGFGEGWVYGGVSSSISSSMKRWGVTNLLEEEKGDEPSNDGESRRHGTREEIRERLQKRVVAKQAGESFRWTRECASDDRPVPRKQTQHFEPAGWIMVTHPKVAPVDQAIGWYE